ncbi:BnaAnng40970D, partial [Brassica napus]
MKNLVRLLLLLLGSSIAGFFGRFLGSEGSVILTTTCVSFFALVGFLFLFRIYYFCLKGPLRGILNLFLVFFIAVVISLIRIKVIHLVSPALPLLEPITWAAVGGRALPSMGPNGAERDT